MLLRTREADIGLTTGINTREIAAHEPARLAPDRLRRAAQQGDRGPQRVRARVRHPPGRRAQGALDLRDHGRRTSVGVDDANSIVLGKHSGRHALQSALMELGYEVAGQTLNTAFKRFKEIADKKKQVTAMDLEALVTDELRADARRPTRSSGSTSRPPRAARRTRRSRSSRPRARPSAATSPATARSTRSSARSTPPRGARRGCASSASTPSPAARTRSARPAWSSSSRGQSASGQGVSTDIIEAAALAYVRALSNVERKVVLAAEAAERRSRSSRRRRERPALGEPPRRGPPRRGSAVHQVRADRGRRGRRPARSSRTRMPRALSAISSASSAALPCSAVNGARAGGRREAQHVGAAAAGRGVEVDRAPDAAVDVLALADRDRREQPRHRARREHRVAHASPSARPARRTARARRCRGRPPPRAAGRRSVAPSVSRCSPRRPSVRCGRGDAAQHGGAGEPAGAARGRRSASGASGVATTVRRAPPRGPGRSGVARRGSRCVPTRVRRDRRRRARGPTTSVAATIDPADVPRMYSQSRKSRRDRRSAARASTLRRASRPRRGRGCPAAQ